MNRGGEIVREVGLPEEIDSPGGGLISRHGLEGVAVSADGRFLITPIQRPFAGEGPHHTRIARLDLSTLEPGADAEPRCTGDWEFFLYPLDPAVSPDQASGLSELISIGPRKYAAVERDEIYAFSLDGLTDGDEVTKIEWLDILKP